MVDKSKKGQKTILIVDDHPFILKAISDLLTKNGKYQVYTAENGFEAIGFVETYPIDLILMDLVMPEKDGIHTTLEIIAQKPEMKILVLTGSYSREDIYKIMEAGAHGYLLKDTHEEEIQFAIEKVMKGEYYFGGKSMEEIIKDFKQIVLPRKLTSHEEIETLTQREKEIIRLIADGLVNKQIASKLFISKRTVDKHRTNILEKLKVNNSAELIAYSVRNGIVE